MKKLIYFFGISLIILTSCTSSDSSSPTDENEVLVSKTIETYTNDGSTFTTNFTYDGKKLLQTTSSDGYYELYTYTGDLLTKIESFNAGNILLQKETYNYTTDGLLESSLSLDYTFNKGFRETYIYNTDGTVSVAGFEGDLVSQVNANRTAIVSFVNGEATNYENTNITFGETSTTTYVYDTKNNPFKNIIGFDKLKFVNSEAVRGTRNILTQGFNSPMLSYVFSSSYSYNGLNFPTSQTTIEVGSPDSSVTTQYIYN